MVLATTRLTEFSHLIDQHIAGCPRPTAERALRMAAIEFCEKTKAWRHVLNHTLTAQGPVIVAPTYATIHQIESATHEGNALTPIGFTAVDPDPLTGLVAVGAPIYITQSSPNEVMIYPYSDGALRLSVFLKPRFGMLFGTDAADPMHDAYNIVPEFMLTQHGETIAHGALARLFAVPNEQWTDETRAAFYYGSFKERCAGAQASTFKGQQRAPLRTKPRWM